MNGRNPQWRPNRRRDVQRDEGAFISLPHSVLKNPAYLALSMSARALLLELALQYDGYNNGRLLLTKTRLLQRNWKSSDMISQGKKELLAGGFIHETVKGHRPNKASWYAMTWYSLAPISGYDEGAAEAFARGAYLRDAPLPMPNMRKKHDWTLPNGGRPERTAKPPRGANQASIAPKRGPAGMRTVPLDGSIEHVGAAVPAPPDGTHLEVPSKGTVRSDCGPSSEVGELI